MSRKPPKTRRPVPEVTRGAFPMLSTFLRGYLHQDWEADYETPVEARDAFLADTSADERREFALECGAFRRLTDELSLGDLVRVLDDSLGSAWAPASASEVREVLRVPSPAGKAR